MSFEQVIKEKFGPRNGIKPAINVHQRGIKLKALLGEVQL